MTCPHDELTLYPELRIATRGGRAVKLSIYGFKILEILQRNSPALTTRVDLLLAVYGASDGAEDESRALSSFLRRLRRSVYPIGIQVETRPGAGHRLSFGALPPKGKALPKGNEKSISAFEDQLRDCLAKNMTAFEASQALGFTVSTINRGRKMHGLPRFRSPPRPTWTDDKLEPVARMMKAGKRPCHIARTLGISRNAIAGALHRHGDKLHALAG
jgi:DNA-binding winged helix-turn-helix (wHTH) protein